VLRFATPVSVLRRQLSVLHAWCVGSRATMCGI